MLYTTPAQARIGKMPSLWSAFTDNHVQHLTRPRVFDFALALHSLGCAFVLGPRALAPPEQCLPFSDLWVLFKIRFPSWLSAVLDSWVPLGLQPWPLLSWLSRWRINFASHLYFCLTCGKQAEKKITCISNFCQWMVKWKRLQCVHSHHLYKAQPR